MLNLRAVVAFAILSPFSLAPAQTGEDRQRALWSNIKRMLMAPGGEEYFNSTLKGAAVPSLRGTLVSGLFNDGISKLVLDLTDSKKGEVTLILHTGELRVKGNPKAGTKIQFFGMPTDFTKDPFMLTFEVSTSGIEGLEFEKSKP